jgi:dTDP-4-amino-4,6-dideoxygalactose transaminase
MGKKASSLVSLSSNALIRLSKSFLKEKEKQAVLRVLDRGFLGMGGEVQLFEKKLSEFLGRQAVCVVNGTAALHLSIQACGIGIGDEVLVPSITYVASFQAISATGATPVACEIDENTLCLDLSDAVNRISPKTKAVMPVHYSGGVGDLDRIYKFAEKYNIRVIEDAAHSFGSTYKNRRIGSFGDISCFSFDGIKNITSGEGGCVVTNDEEILNLVKDARLLGVEKDSEKRYNGKRSWDYKVKQQGWRYHMSDIMAAIGIEQLSRFNEIAEKRQKLAKFYVNQLKNEQQLRFINHNYNEVVPHIFPIIFCKKVNRNLVIDHLDKNNIQTGIHYKPNHLHRFFNSKYNNNFHLHTSEEIFKSLLTLPLHEGLTEEEVKFICKLLQEIIKK